MLVDNCFSEACRLVHVDSSLDKPSFSVRPKVGVLMSTYNGARFLLEQIESIASQSDVDVALFVRDDGSSDGTVALLSELSASPLGAIVEWNLDFGENLGFLSSFERLLLSVSGCDYYAFSDQDDVWDSQKLAAAAGCCAPYGSLPIVYASSVQIADEKLSPLGLNSFNGFQYSIPSEFIRHRLAGHTMLWNSSLQETIRSIGPLSCWSHDQHVVLAALLSGSDLILDRASYVLHRRLDSSVTPGGGNPLKRLAHELNLMLNRGGKMHRSLLAREILSQRYSISDNDEKFLTMCRDSRRLSLAFDPSFNCGLALGNLEGRLSVLLGRF